MVTNDNKINIAICGAGRFAKRRVIPAIDRCKNAELVAIVRALQGKLIHLVFGRISKLDDLILAKS